METWLEPILPYTFRTVSFELTKEELDTIVLCNQARFKKQVVHEAQEVLRKVSQAILSSLSFVDGEVRGKDRRGAGEVWRVWVCEVEYEVCCWFLRRWLIY